MVNRTNAPRPRSRESSAVDWGALSPALLAELKRQRSDRKTAPRVRLVRDSFLGWPIVPRISANVFHVSCSLAPVMKMFSLRFKSEGQGTPQMESSLVISLTSPKNAGALGPQ
jgi:hypothetical protein